MKSASGQIRRNKRVSLIEARVNRGLTLPAAAEQIGVSRHVLGNAEQGRGIRETSAKTIADFYGFEKVTDAFPVEEWAA